MTISQQGFGIVLVLMKLLSELFSLY